MQKGYKRNRKGIAVLNFFIGLIVLAIVVCVIYFFIEKVDYSDKLKDPEASMRPYVEVTASPDAAPTAEIPDEPEGDPGYVDISDPADSVVTEAPTIQPTVVPTAEPTPTPEPTPIASPTPEPTSVPKSVLSEAKFNGFTVPAASDNGTVAITNLYVSAPDSNKIVVIDGYGFIDEEAFDGSTAQIYLIVTQASSGKQIAYKCKMIEGISGDPHEAVICKNAAKTDFEAGLNVSQYPDGDYKLGIILQYTRSGVTAYSYYTFDDTITVSGGSVAAEGAFN